MIDVQLKQLANALLAAPNIEFPRCVDIDSYRGYYMDLAIGEGRKYSFSHLLGHALLGAIGQTFQGYKGGDYIMHEDTTVWLADHGLCEPSSVTPWLMPIILRALYPEGQSK